jgi:hypothetical protein
VSLVPSGAVRSAGPDAAELAAECGLLLDEWQALVLDQAMGELPDGRWAASDVDLIASRQNGKNGAVEARELYGAVILGEQIIHTAHLFKTTKESYNRLLTLVDAHPDVRERLTWKVASPASGYEMQFRGGGRVQFIARSRSSGRGLTGDVLVLDEAQDLDDDALGALLPTISSGPAKNRQAWYLGSAPGPLSAVWNRRRRSGREGGDSRRAYFEFSADPACDLDDRDAWAQANPGLGVRLPEDAIEAERAAMSDEMFARERLSVSPDIENRTHVIPLTVWDSREDTGSEAGRVCFGFDVSPDLKWAVIAAAGRRPDGLMHLEVVDNLAGTSRLASRLAELHKRWTPPFVACDPSGPAGAFINDVLAAGVEVKAASARDYQQACGAFYDDAMNDGCRHLGQPLVRVALAGAEKRPLGDAWVWSRKNSNVDISPLVAVTLAAWAASIPTDDGPSVYEERGMATL